MDEFPTEFVKPFVICLDLLNRSCIQIFDKRASFLKRRCLSILFVTCAIVYHVSLSVYISKAFSGGVKFFELVDAVPVILVSTQGILKSAIVVPKKAEIRAIILQLGTMWRTNNLSDEQINKKNALMRRLNLCHSVFYWLNIIGTWQYMLVPLFETLFRIFILQQECDLLFPFACSYPFDPRKTWLRYIAVYTFEVYSMLHLIYIYLGAEFLMITLCAHLSTEFALLQYDLRHAKPTSDQNDCKDDICLYNEHQMGLKDIIRRHQKLIMLSQKLDAIFNPMIFFNLLFATITICFFGFVAKVAHGPTDMINNFVGVFASMIPIFNLCYYGELLTGASAGVADSAYQNLWYKGDIGHQKTMCIVMTRSQIPCCLTSLKYAPITLKTFTSVLSTTWSYFSLATRLYDEEAD